jgi:hypothetical protein
VSKEKPGLGHDHAALHYRGRNSVKGAAARRRCQFVEAW